MRRRWRSPPSDSDIAERGVRRRWRSLRPPRASPRRSVPLNRPRSNPALLDRMQRALDASGAIDASGPDRTLAVAVQFERTAPPVASAASRGPPVRACGYRRRFACRTPAPRSGGRCRANGRGARMEPLPPGGQIEYDAPHGVSEWSGAESPRTTCGRLLSTPTRSGPLSTGPRARVISICAGSVDAAARCTSHCLRSDARRDRCVAWRVGPGREQWG